MIVLGMGSNVGDRLDNLRKALAEIKRNSAIEILQVSPVYISDAMPAQGNNWNQPYLNAALRIKTDLAPFDLLKFVKSIEIKLGRPKEQQRWEVRCIDIDILTYDDLQIKNETLQIPHHGLLERPFALWPLADVAATWIHPLEKKSVAEIVEKLGSRFTGEAPFHTKMIYQRIDTPQLVGVVNITPDSFSDGDLFLQVDCAQQQITHLVYSGAEIIDLGAESTAPHATAITEAKEWERLQPVLVALKEIKNDFIITPKISIDTRHPNIAKQALALGVDWINDVTGLSTLEMQEVIAESTCDCVVMHHIRIPEDRNQVVSREQNIVEVVYAWAQQKIAELEKNGIKRERIIIDPGIGFGKLADQSFELIKHVDRFSNLGVRLLVGHSRKSFLQNFTHHPAKERDVETLILSLYLANQKVDYLRVHNTEKTSRAFRLEKAL